MSIDRHFSHSYSEARDKFRAAVAHAKVPIEHFVHPTERAPDGSELATDVALFGPEDAGNLLILLSGVHGIEGYAGSGCQVALIERVRFVALPMSTAVLVVHALEPYGFAWDRRVNENNVDINCNAIDATEPPTPTPHYQVLHPHLIPTQWQGPARDAAEAAIAAFIAKRGERAYIEAITAGQYAEPDGLSYGGTRLEWATRTFITIMKRWAEDKHHIGLIDFHSGPGMVPHAEGMHIHTSLAADEAARARVWFGVRATSGEPGVCVAHRGTLTDALAGVSPRAARTPVQLRFDTVEWALMQQCWRAEHWHHRHGEVDSPVGRDIGQALRDCFYIDTKEWKARAVHHAEDVVGQALGGLSL